MKIPRDTSGAALATCFCKHWGYRQMHQSGSHTILDTEIPSHHRVAVPAHAALRIGTLNAILRAVAAHKGVTRDAILATL